MVNVLRRWSKPIMVLITVLVCVSFLYWGPNVNPATGGKQVVFAIYGQDVTLDALKRQARKVAIFEEMRGEYIGTLEPSTRFGRPVDNGTVARSFVFEREMDELGLSATDEERLEALEQIPFFRGPDGKFDPNTFMQFKQKVLNSEGFSDTDFDSIFLSGEVRARKLRALLGSPITVPPDQLRQEVLQNRMKTEASYVAFRSEDFKGEVKLTEEEVRKRFDEQKELFKTAEQRKVRYAAFLLPPTPDGKPMEQKQRIAKLQELANAAYTFREEVETTKGNFEELAKKNGGTVGETKEFFPLDKPPAELAESRPAASAAFALTKERPYSPHITTDKGTFVLELMEIKEPEQRPFESVKKEIEDQLTREKADEIARTKANEARPKLEAAMKGGKKFADAARELGLKVEEFPAFGGNAPQPNAPFGDVVVRAAAKLAPGQISEALGTAENDATLIVHVDHRSAGDEKDLEAAMANTRTMMEDYAIFPTVMRVWLDERCRAAGLVFGQGDQEG